MSTQRTNEHTENPAPWDEIEAHAERLLAQFPPTTEEQRQRVQALMLPNGLGRRAA